MRTKSRKCYKNCSSMRRTLIQVQFCLRSLLLYVSTAEFSPFRATTWTFFSVLFWRSTWTDVFSFMNYFTLQFLFYPQQNSILPFFSWFSLQIFSLSLSLSLSHHLCLFFVVNLFSWNCVLFFQVFFKCFFSISIFPFCLFLIFFIRILPRLLFVLWSLKRIDEILKIQTQLPSVKLTCSLSWWWSHVSPPWSYSLQQYDFKTDFIKKLE